MKLLSFVSLLADIFLGNMGLLADVLFVLVGINNLDEQSPCGVNYHNLLCSFLLESFPVSLLCEISLTSVTL